MRRVKITGGQLSLMDYCSAAPQYASGGFIADSQLPNVINGSQQQWYMRNSSVTNWSNAVWNQVFSGVEGAPSDAAFPDPPYTSLASTPLSREKPFLYLDAKGAYQVRVPAAAKATSGVSWANGMTAGRSIPLTGFFVAKPSDSVRTINDQLARGKNLLLTPGIYNVSQSIEIKRANTVVLGLERDAVGAALADAPVVDLDLSGDRHVGGRGAEAGDLGVVAHLDLQRRAGRAVGTWLEQECVARGAHLGVRLDIGDGVQLRLDLRQRHARVEDRDVGAERLGGLRRRGLDGGRRGRERASGQTQEQDCGEEAPAGGPGRARLAWHHGFVESHGGQLLPGNTSSASPKGADCDAGLGPHSVRSPAQSRRTRPSSSRDASARSACAASGLQAART